MTRHDMAQRNEQQTPTSRHGNLQYTQMYSAYLTIINWVSTVVNYRRGISRNIMTKQRFKNHSLTTCLFRIEVTIFSERERRYMLSPVRLSVVCLSVVCL